MGHMLTHSVLRSLSMYYLKQLCVIGVTVILYFIVIEVYLNDFYNTYQQLGHMQKDILYPTVMNPIQMGSKWTNADPNFDFELLQKKFKHETCKKRKKLALLAGNSSYHTGLMSFPASGNTWTRNLVQQLTGIHTCAAASKVVAGENVSIESIHSKNCIVYKSHLSTAVDMAPFNRAVIIIRDPLYALKSYFHYLYGQQKDKDLSARNREERHTGYADTSLFLSPKWTFHVKTKLSVWKNSYISWFSYFKQNCTVVLYENMKQNVLPELLRIIGFLRIQVKPKDLWCSLVNQEGRYHRLSRNMTETSVFNLFTAKQKEEVLKSVCQVSEVARSLDIDLDISQYLVNLSETPDTACH